MLVVSLRASTEQVQVCLASEFRENKLFSGLGGRGPRNLSSASWFILLQGEVESNFSSETFSCLETPFSLPPLLFCIEIQSLLS